MGTGAEEELMGMGQGSSAGSWWKIPGVPLLPPQGWVGITLGRPHTLARDSQQRLKLPWVESGQVNWAPEPTDPGRPLAWPRPITHFLNFYPGLSRLPQEP